MALSKYDLSNEIKTSTELGVLTPIHWQDVVPGDRIRCNGKSIIRLQPLLSPIYNSISYNVRYYYVPYRLLVKDYGRYFAEDPAVELYLPTLFDHLNAGEVESDFNYLRLFGINWRGDLTNTILDNISALPFRALHLVYNYFFKNELLDDSYLDMMKPEQFAYPQFKGFQFIAPLFATYYNDYFTDAYPSPQVGTPVDVDLNSDSQILVPEIDFATRLQRFKERLLLVGKSYKKFLQRFHGVNVHSDLLDFPRLIGSASQILNISDVDQVAPSDEEPVGSVYGKSVTVASNFGYTQEFKEHGIVLGLSYVLPSTSYVQGIPREFQKKTRFDFYTPDFASVGMQPLRGNELSAERTDTFGYTPRYGELRQSKNVIAGDFADSLSYWHFGRSLGGENLSKDFVTYVANNAPFSVRGTEFTKLITKTAFLLEKDGQHYFAVGGNQDIGQGSVLIDTRTAYSAPSQIEQFRIVVHRDITEEVVMVNVKNGSGAIMFFPRPKTDQEILVFWKNAYLGESAPPFRQIFYNVLPGDTEVNPATGGFVRPFMLSVELAFHTGKLDELLNPEFFDKYSSMCVDSRYFVTPVKEVITNTQLGTGSIVFDVPRSHFSAFDDGETDMTFYQRTETKSYNHVLIANYNTVDALRPIPKLEF